MVNVFVYGTLRKGESNHYFLSTATCIAEQCWTYGLMYDSGYGYPAIIEDGHARVYGELYAVTESELEALDDLEDYKEGGTNNLYDRVERTVYTDAGEVNAYVYIAHDQDLLKKKIPQGDWKEYRLFSTPRDSVLYFAYGSCMDTERMMKDGVAHYFQNVIGVGILQNYSVQFTQTSMNDGKGRADIMEIGGTVEGKVYQIPIAAIREYLYRREGAPYAYRATFVTVEVNGENRSALTFVVTNKRDEKAPPSWYVDEIMRGADGILSDSYLLALQDKIASLNKTEIGV